MGQMVEEITQPARNWPLVCEQKTHGVPHLFTYRDSLIFIVTLIGLLNVTPEEDLENI